MVRRSSKTNCPRCAGLGQGEVVRIRFASDPMPAKPVLGAGRILPRAAAPWGRGGSGDGSEHWVPNRGGTSTNPDWKLSSWPRP
jgi:hypothetical protein